MPIDLPKGVEVNIEQAKVTVKGPKGVLSRDLHPEMLIRVDDGKIAEDGLQLDLLRLIEQIQSSVKMQRESCER